MSLQILREERGEGHPRLPEILREPARQRISKKNHQPAQQKNLRHQLRENFGLRIKARNLNRRNHQKNRWKWFSPRRGDAEGRGVERRRTETHASSIDRSEELRVDHARAES